jgi:hypothetical protein
MRKPSSFRSAAGLLRSPWIRARACQYAPAMRGGAGAQVTSASERCARAQWDGSKIAPLLELDGVSFIQGIASRDQST